MIRWNLFFEVEKVEQLALIDPLATHHDRPPSLKASGKRNHDSSIFTRPFSTGSTHSRRRIKALLVRQCPEAADDGRAEQRPLCPGRLDFNLFGYRERAVHPQR